MHYNTSTPTQDEDESSAAKLVLKAISLLVYIAVGTCGNGKVLYAIRSDERMHTPLNTFIAFLSLCDFIMCVFIMPFAFFSLVLGRWVFGSTFCAIHYVISIYLGKTSVLCIFAMIIERYLTICRRRYPSLSKSTIKGILATIFLLPLPFSLLVFRQNLDYFWATGTCFNSHKIHQNESAIIFIADSILLKCLPTVALLFLLWKIFIVLHRLKTRVSPGLLSNEDKLTASAHAHSACTSATFVTIYVALALPVYVVMIVHRYSVVSGKSGLSSDARVAAVWLFWLGCVIKPIIYVVRQPTYINYLLRRFPGARPNHVAMRNRGRNRVNRSVIYRAERDGNPQDGSSERAPPAIRKLAFGDFNDLTLVEAESSYVHSNNRSLPGSQHCSTEGRFQSHVPETRSGSYLDSTEARDYKLTAALLARMRQTCERDSFKDSCHTQPTTIPGADNQAIGLHGEPDGRSSIASELTDIRVTDFSDAEGTQAG